VHILFLTDNFPPEVNAPASRTFEHCREWVNAGNRVTVITCAPNFPRGQVFEGYKNSPWQSEMVDGIRVIRVWSYITANEGFLKRVLDYQSFMFSAMFASLFVTKVDVVVGTSPQFFTACAAWLVSKFKRTPWIFELRDLWPESIKAVGAIQNPRIIRSLEKLELFLYRSADRIVSVTHAFKSALIDRGIDGGKIDVITNGVDISRFCARAKDVDLEKKLSLAGKFVVGYIGTHGMAHCLETLLDAASQLQALPGAQDFHFVFLGDGSRKLALQQYAQQRELRNVLFLDSVLKDEVPRYWSLLDVSVIHLRNTELFTTVIPSKLFECMGMGIPVLHGVPGESSEIVVREGVGQIFAPENAQSLVAALRGMRSDAHAFAAYRANGLRAAKRYDRKNLAAAMLDSIIHSLARTKVRSNSGPRSVLDYKEGAEQNDTPT
jgi:glycosyltransferase involved in cell wall biosynthesis